jgi:hypothetical protein
MNRRIKLSWTVLVLWVVANGLASAADANKQVKDLELDDHVVYTIPVASSRVTTISFPGPIAAIDAALVTTDAKHAGSFQLAHTKGSYFFSIRSLVKDAATNVNVRWNNKTYVLELQESKTPLLSVVFHAANGKAHPAGAAVTPGRLLGLLDKAKAYPLLKANHPEAVEKVDFLPYGEKPPVMDYGEFEVSLKEAFRFDPEDTLIFRVSLRNKTDKEIVYNPQGFSLRVGERLFFQSISDASGVIPPKGETPAYFAITGTVTGGRNDVSLKNEFTVLVARADKHTTGAADDQPRGSQVGFKK